LFAKRLSFLYKTDGGPVELDAQKPLGDNQEINFLRVPIEIEIKIEHIGA